MSLRNSESQYSYEMLFWYFSMTKQITVLVILSMVIMTITTMTSITTSSVNAQSQGNGDTQPAK